MLVRRIGGAGSKRLTIPELLGLRDLGLHFPPSSIWVFGGGESGHSSRLVVSGKREVGDAECGLVLRRGRSLALVSTLRATLQGAELWTGPYEDYLKWVCFILDIY
jgi:hypothetical protein